MSILKKYGEVFNKNDAKAFMELFADDCVFYDAAPTAVGMDPIYIRGKAGIYMMFNMYFHAMRIEATVKSIDGNVMEYDIGYPDLGMPPVLCRGELIEEEDGKIVRYHVYPRT